MILNYKRWLSRGRPANLDLDRIRGPGYPGPRSDPGVRNYRAELLPRVLTHKRARILTMTDQRLHQPTVRQRR